MASRALRQRGRRAKRQREAKGSLGLQSGNSQSAIHIVWIKVEAVYISTSFATAGHLGILDVQHSYTFYNHLIQRSFILDHLSRCVRVSKAARPGRVVKGRPPGREPARCPAARPAPRRLTRPPRTRHIGVWLLLIYHYHNDKRRRRTRKKTQAHHQILNTIMANSLTYKILAFK